MLGIFDSGVGGLTVVQYFLRRKPGLSFVYLGDTSRVPYGNKSLETIRRYTMEGVRFLVDQGATDIIIACNTMSLCVEEVRCEFPTIRFFDVIEPAIEAVERSKGKRIGVIGTRATIQAGVYQERIKQRMSRVDVLAQACPLFVPLVEEGETDRPEIKRIVRRMLHPLRQAQIDTLILGCTHYPILQEVIAQAIGKRVTIIDSPAALYAMMERTAPNLLDEDDSSTAQRRLCFTDVSTQTKAIVRRWLGHGFELERVNL